MLEKIKNIAVIGFSPNPAKDSHKVGMYLKNQGYNIFAIYPKGEKIGDLPIYKSLKCVAENNKIECVVVFRKSEACLEIAKEILNLNLKIKLFWMQQGIQNENAKKILESNSIKVVQNLCIMLELEKLKLAKS